MPSTAWSTGASSKMMLAALPPSSSVARLPLPAIERWMPLPTSVEPVKAILSTSSCSTMRAAGVAGAGDDVDDAGGQVGLLADLGEQQRRQRRGLGGLQHHGVATRQRRRDLPRQHQQREVPRDDLAGDAERLRVGAEPGPRELVGPPGVVEEVGGDERDVDVARLLDRLAVVDGLEHGELAGPLLDDPGDAVEVLPALGTRQLRPRREAAAGGGHGAVDVDGVRLGHVGEDLLGRRAHGLEGRPARRVDELPADEQPVVGADVDDVTGLGRRGVVPRGGHEVGDVGVGGGGGGGVSHRVGAPQSRVK